MNKKNNKGYSLIEVLFVVVIFAIIGLAITKISNFSWQSYTYNQEKSTMHRNRIAIEKIIKQTRNALQININNSGEQMTLKKVTANKQYKYYHYLLNNNNLYLHINHNPHFITDLSKLTSQPKLIIGEKIITNYKLFTWAQNNLVTLNFKFKKDINSPRQEQIKLEHSIIRKVYPRNHNININLKDQSEVQNDD